jgi:hypothetical protein
MGGRNPFLGIAYIVVGGICILMGAIFTGTHLIKPRSAGLLDETLLINRTIGNSATTRTSLGTKIQARGRLGEALGQPRRIRHETLAMIFVCNCGVFLP